MGNLPVGIHGFRGSDIGLEWFLGRIRPGQSLGAEYSITLHVGCWRFGPPIHDR